MAKTYKLVFILSALSLTFFWGCSKKVDCCTVVDVAVQIHYQNQVGENLLVQGSAFDPSYIKVFFKNGDTFEYVNTGNLDYPNSHFVEDTGGKKLLTVFPSNHYEGNWSTTLIVLNEVVRDTLLCEFALSDNKEICKRAWLNGVELQSRFIAVKK
jgi:hypothetical protein